MRVETLAVGKGLNSPKLNSKTSTQLNLPRRVLGTEDPAKANVGDAAVRRASHDPVRGKNVRLIETSHALIHPQVVSVYH